MSWRHTIKGLFAQKVVDALGTNFKGFGPWNSQTTNSDTEETFPEFYVYFEYSLVGDGLEYLLSTNIQQADRVPVEVTLHLVFHTFNDQFQDLAYEYAELITCYLAGQKHELIHGRILKVNELEDTNHDALYDYQITFGFQLKEAVYKIVGLVDANPETGEFPPTGRKITPVITVGVRQP